MTFFSHLISEGRDEYSTYRKTLRTPLALMMVKRPLAFEIMLATIIGNPGVASRRPGFKTHLLAVRFCTTSRGLDISIGSMGMNHLLCLQDVCDYYRR